MNLWLYHPWLAFRFRMRECNLLISTNILEDGVDIPKCNLVIRFDAPNNFISYVNSKGRARSNDSYYILMLLKDEVDRTLNSLSSYYALQEVPIIVEYWYCSHLSSCLDTTGKMLLPWGPNWRGNWHQWMLTIFSLIFPYKKRFCFYNYCNLTS